MTKKEAIKQTLLLDLCLTGSFTRPDFIKRHGVRAATVFAAVDDLKSDGLIVEPARRGVKTGRKSPELRINADYGHFIGLELQPGRLTGVVIDADGNVITDAELIPDEDSDVRKLTLAIEQILSRLRDNCGRERRMLRGVGFADPGLVDISNKISLRAVNVLGWENIETGRILRQMTACAETLVVPETAARTFAEYMARAPEFPRSLFQMSLDAGVGGGFMKNGELFIGDSYRGMEIGHVVIVPNGPLCQCGNRGCLEAVAGEVGIRRRISELIVNGVDTALSLENFSVGALVSMFGRDRAATMLVNEICENIGLGLATAISLLNPSTVVLSGEITGLGETLTGAIKRVLLTHCFPGALEQLSLEISALDDYATARAAALMCRNRRLAQILLVRTFSKRFERYSNLSNNVIYSLVDIDLSR